MRFCRVCERTPPCELPQRGKSPLRRLFMGEGKLPQLSKALRSFAPAGAKESKSFFPATCAAEKTPTGLPPEPSEAVPVGRGGATERVSFRPQGGSEGCEVRSDDEAECRISRLWRLTEARSDAKPSRTRLAAVEIPWYPIPRHGRVLEIES